LGWKREGGVTYASGFPHRLAQSSQRRRSTSRAASFASTMAGIIGAGDLNASSSLRMPLEHLWRPGGSKTAKPCAASKYSTPTVMCATGPSVYEARPIAPAQLRTGEFHLVVSRTLIFQSATNYVADRHMAAR
jgi:hypothetical protein